MKSIVTAAAAAVLSLAFAVSAFAQQPGKPMRIIVPYAAGGVTDAVARAVAARLAEVAARPVLVENRPGGSTMIGMQQCARADRTAALPASPSRTALSYNPQLFTNLPYDAEKEFRRP